MNNNSQPTLLFCVSNEDDKKHVKTVCLSWNKNGPEPEAAYVVDLGRVTFQFDLNAIGNAHQLTRAVSAEIRFNSVDTAHELACWILQNAGKPPDFKCPKEDHEAAESEAVETHTPPSKPSKDDPNTVSVSEQFTVTDGPNTVSLSWNVRDKRVSYLVHLGDVKIDFPTTPGQINITKNVRATVKMNGVTVVRELAGWILNTVPLDKPFVCRGICPLEPDSTPKRGPQRKA